MTTPEPQPDEVPTAVDTSPPDVDAEVDDAELDPKTRAAMQKLRREAHNLRTRLHETEERLGAAAARETVRDRAEVERIAAEHLIEAADVWRAQPDIQSYYDEEFAQIVPDKVRETAQALAAEKPHLAKAAPTPPPTDRPLEGLRGGGPAAREEKPVSWSSVLHRQ